MASKPTKKPAAKAPAVAKPVVAKSYDNEYLPHDTGDNEHTERLTLLAHLPWSNCTRVVFNGDKLQEIEFREPRGYGGSA